MRGGERSALLIDKKRLVWGRTWMPGAFSARIGQEEAIWDHRLAVTSVQRSRQTGDLRPAQVTAKQGRVLDPPWRWFAPGANGSQAEVLLAPREARDELNLAVTCAGRKRFA